ncbi:MAG: alpha/beta hydrolase [Verrucomicrobiales bacterium]
MQSHLECRMVIARRITFWLVATLLLISLLGCSGIAVYNHVVAQRASDWEASLEWCEDGVRRGCEEFVIGSETGGTLLMVHGFGDVPEVWRPMAKAFAKLGYRCHAVRLPGFSEPLQARRDFVWQNWTNSVTDTFQSGPGPIIVVGHSLGGATLIRAVLDEQIKPQAVILLAPLLEVSNRRSVLLSPRKWFQLFGQHIPLTESPFPRDVLKPHATDHLPTDRFTPRSVYTALFAMLELNWAQAEHFTTPLFLATTPHDRVVRSDRAIDWFDRTPSGLQKMHVSADKSGHVLPLDYDADSLVQEIHTFIQSL